MLLHANVNDTPFDHKSPGPPEESVSQRHRQTDRQTNRQANIATRAQWADSVKIVSLICVTKETNIIQYTKQLRNSNIFQKINKVRKMVVMDC